MEYQFHPAADLFPMMTDEELNALGDDMLEHAQREEIILYRGQILDGRNRYRACLLKGIEPKFREERPADPYAFVASANLHRRHLDLGQRAMIAAKIANLQHGGDRSKPSNDGLSAEKAASLLNVSPASAERAKQVKDHGVDMLVAAVETGNVAVSAAAKFVHDHPPSEQNKLIMKAGGSVATAVEKANAKAKAKVKTKAARATKSPNTAPDPKLAMDRGETRARLDVARATYVTTVEAAHLTRSQLADEIKAVVRLLRLDELQDFQHLVASSSGCGLN